MKIQSINSKQKLASIVSSISKSPSSWQGWSCLKIEITGDDSLNLYQESLAAIQSILETYLKDIEGSVYFCQNQHVHVFCKNAQNNILQQTGKQIQDFLQSETSLAVVEFDIFNLENDGFIYVNDTLEQEDGMYTIPVSIYAGLDPFISRAVSSAQDHFTEKNIRSYQNYAKVLLVEDDPVTRWVVRKSLKNECVFATATTANQAFQVFSSFQPDLVFLDIDLPDKNGRQVLEWIMRHDPGTSVVMFSSNNNLENISDTLESGARGFIAKPFIKEDFINYINEHSG